MNIYVIEYRLKGNPKSKLETYIVGAQNANSARVMFNGAKNRNKVYTITNVKLG